MAQSYLALVLHAHLPYVRHPEYEDSLEENWLFEAISETYVPLILVLEGLLADGIDFRLTLSLTPTLSSMLLDPLLQQRYLKKLERSLELAERELARTRRQPSFHALAHMYRDFFRRVHDAFLNRYDRNLVRAFRRFQELGKVEIIASAATHGYLPLLSASESAVRTQLGVGLEYYQQAFGRSARGFWLPECGFYPGLDKLLSERGVRFTILETHGLTRASQRPRYGVYAPLFCPSGLAVFGRDPDSSRQVWSSVEGYPGDYDYREFYRDIGYDLDLDYIKPYIHRDGIRIDTGFKYYRITGRGKHKEPYQPEHAAKKAELHARHFLSERLKQIESLAQVMDRKPIIVAPYDAELFGHWWFEGPQWLDHLIRRIAEQDTIRLVTLSEYLEEYPVNQVAVPSMSSWGHRGFNEVWLNRQNHWIYPHLLEGARLMERLGRQYAQAGGLTRRALDQAARELLLAQASDWAFMINSGAMEQYATRRTKTHLLRLLRLSRQIETGTIDEAWLADLEGRDNIFPQIAAAAEFMRPLPANAGKVRQAPPAGLEITMVCSELFPFAKTGGLADMVSALAQALARLGHRMSIILPAYRCVLEGGFAVDDAGIRIAVPVGSRREHGAVFRAMLGDRIPVYLVRADKYFDRERLYGTPEGDYPDNAERFVFFARAALEVLRKTGAPHILHAHDWQAALAVVFLKAQRHAYAELSGMRTVLTVHNLGYQGLFWGVDWPLLNLDGSLFSPRYLEFYGKLNFLKGGLVFADTITTVSPTYAREIRTPEYGCGLEGVLEERAADLVGILNGADYEVWNPATDPFIAARYSASDLSGKQLSKRDLQRRFGLPEAPGLPLVGMVSRLTAQKGFDLFETVLDELAARRLQLVVLGTGDRRYEDSLRAAAARHPGKIGVRIGFDEALAHQIEAGADIFLMPSRYEPGGLNQIYSLRYGAIPVVRATGGLKDTVQEYDPASGRGNGFLFGPYEAASMLSALDRALAVFRRKEEWTMLVRNAMSADYSWDRSAREYAALYLRRTPSIGRGSS